MSEQNTNPYNRNYVGIGRPVCADLFVLGIQFDISIKGKDWQSMTVEQRIEHYKAEFNARIEIAMAEIEHHTKWYCEKIEPPKEET